MINKISIDDIYYRGGGVIQLAVKLGYGTTTGVYYWRTRGVPGDRIKSVSAITGIKESAIEELNTSLRITRLEAKRKKKVK